MDDDERTAADHRKSAEDHDESATRHDRAAADWLARGDAERAGRELLAALIERQLAKDERERAGLEDEERLGADSSRGRSPHHRARQPIVAEQERPTQQPNTSR